MAKPWTIVTDNLTGYDLEEIENPQRRELTCPSCEKTGIFTEKELVKNLKILGVSVVSVEDSKRVYQCPFCNSAVEPPPDVALAPDDPRVAALKRRMSKAREDIDVWSRRAELAQRSGDDVLAKEAQGVAEQNRELVAKYSDEIDRLTSTDGTGTTGAKERSTIVATQTSAGVKREDTTVDRDFAALKARFSQKSASNEAPTDGKEVASSKPRRRAPEPEEQEVRDARIAKEADDELAILKARLQGKSLPSTKSAATTKDTSLPSTSAGTAGNTTEELSQSRDDVSWFRPQDEEQQSYGGGSADYDPTAVSGPSANSNPSASAPPAKSSTVGPTNEPVKPSEPAGTDDDDDDPVAALKRKLKKP